MIRIIEYLATKISNDRDHFTFDFQNYDVYFYSNKNRKKLNNILKR